MDGARLGHALTSEANDMSLEDVAELTDIFYLGGTKNGALLGEAIAINNPKLQPDFDYNIKQKGALLAKGRILGIQFLELMKDDLYFDLARHANIQAMRIKAAFRENGITFLSETYTNQIFPILTNSQIEKLQRDFDFYIWQKIDETHSAIRLITSWSTNSDRVNELIHQIKSL